MITVDQKVQFDVFRDVKDRIQTAPYMATGTVYAVNYGHRVFHVVYDLEGTEMRTSFNFCDIGEKVHIIP